MGRGGATSDISFIDESSGSPEFGFTLARNSKGRPIYEERELSGFNALQATGYLDEASQNPETAYPISFQKSWVGGYGQAFMKSDEPRRYYASYSVDPSEEGVLKLGPDWTAVNWPTVATYSITDGGVETWTTTTDLTSWTETLTGNGTVNRSTAQVHGGTYSALLNSGATAGTAQISQSIATWTTEFRSKRFTATVWVRQTDASKATIAIYDGVGTTTGATSATTGSWVQLSVTRQLSATATECTIQVKQLTGDSIYSYVDDVAIVGYTIANANCYAEYNGLQHMSLGDILYTANSATSPTSWTYVDNYTYNITALFSGQVSGTAYLFAMIGAGNTLAERGWYWDGSTSTQMTDGGGTDASGDYMASTSTTFYITGRPTGVTTGAKSVIRTNTTPLAGTWSTDIQVGDPNTNLTGATNVNNVVYFAKEDSLWKVNTDGTVSMVVDYRMLYSSTSGKRVVGWNGKVYIPCGVNSLIEYDPDTGTYSDISPASLISSTTQAQISVSGALLSAVQADFDGRIMAVAGGNEWLWLLQDNGSVNNLFKGRYANIDSTGWHWHPVANTTMADANAMYVSALTGAPIIWAAHGTGNPGYYDLAKYETSDPTYTTPMIITPYYTGGVWRMMKALHSILLGLESITANVYVTLQYRFYGTTSWSTALTFDGAAGTVTNGQDQQFLPTDSFGTAIQFRLNFVSNANTATPKVTRINGEGVIRPAVATLYDFVVKLIDHDPGKNASPDSVLASRKRTCLDNVRANNWPVTMYDRTGTSRTVDVLNLEQLNWDREYGKNPTMTYHVQARKAVLA